MQRLHERLIALAADERQTLAALAEHALEPAGERLVLAARGAGGSAGAAARIRDVIGEAEALARVLESSESGVIDVADPVIRAWLGRRRDALLSLLRDDRAALYDQLALARAAAISPDEDPGIAHRWRLVDEDLEELALIAGLLSEALDAGPPPASAETSTAPAARFVA